MALLGRIRLPSFLLVALITLLTFPWRGLGLSSASAPFPVRRVSRAPTFPVDRDDVRLKEPPKVASPAFKPSTSYTYEIGLNSSSDVFQFPTTVGQAPSSEGFGANVTAVLQINTEALDQSPDPDSVVFAVSMTVSNCNVQKGPSTWHRSSGEFMRDPQRSTNDSCGLDDTTIVSQPLVYITQSLTSGDFLNVYWNQSTSAQDPSNNLQDPAAYTKLLVSAVRTLQSTYKHTPGSKSYVVQRPNRLGISRNVTYTYIGTARGTDNPCFEVNAESMDGDQFEQLEQTICYADSSTGGVSMASTGDSADLGTPDAPAVVPLLASLISDWTTLTSQDDTASAYKGPQELPDPGFGVVTDVKAGYIFVNGSTSRSYTFTVDEKGVMTRWAITDGNTVVPAPIENAPQRAPVASMSGVSLQQISSVAGNFRYVFAVDTQGIIWVAVLTTNLDYGEGWSKLTDGEDDMDATSQALEFYPWTSLCASVSVPSAVFGFWVSISGQAYITSIATCLPPQAWELHVSTDAPIISAQVPSIDVVQVTHHILQLQPVGVSWVLPHIAAVTASQKLVFSFYSPNNSINIADGYSDWVPVDLGTDHQGVKVNVTHIERFYFPPTFEFPDGTTLGREDDGILAVLSNSSVVSILVSSSATNALGTPQLVLDADNKPIIGVDSVSKQFSG